MLQDSTRTKNGRRRDLDYSGNRIRSTKVVVVLTHQERSILRREAQFTRFTHKYELNVDTNETTFYVVGDRNMSFEEAVFGLKEELAKGIMAKARIHEAQFYPAK